MAKGFRILLLAVAGLIGSLLLAAGAYIYRNTNYARWDAKAVEKAGFTEQQVAINGSTINFAEGPNNGLPLLLIHGQSVAWQNWHRVLPALSDHFHIFAVDCYGHGGSEHVAGKYTARALAADLGAFIEQIIGEPALVAGHSSGGLIAAALAAEQPEGVLGVVLEDPPFFSSVLPRAKKTFNYVDLSTTAHDFLQSDASDFTAYQIQHSALWALFGNGGKNIQQNALGYHQRHPGEPVVLFYMPPLLNESFRYFDSYDARFGDSFYTGTFHQSFDHADTLSRINLPAILMHTNWQVDSNGILLAAMSGEDAERAHRLINDVEFFKVNSGHGFHFEKPNQFVQIVLDFKPRLAQRSRES